MYISQAKKFIFVHNPKTAGRSTIHALGFEEEATSGLYHLRPDEAKRRIFQETWMEYFSFAFVRNPWDRMVSLYEYQRGIEYAVFGRHNASHQLARSYSFEEWLEINESGLRRANWYGIPQSEWIASVSKVYMFEHYEQAMQDISDRLGLEEIGPFHINKSQRGGYKGYYNCKRSIDIVERIDGEVIEAFGYCF